MVLAGGIIATLLGMFVWKASRK